MRVYSTQLVVSAIMTTAYDHLLPYVVPLVEHAYRDPCVEIEARLGRYDEQTRRFESNVSDQYFMSLLNTIRTAVEGAPDDWRVPTNWVTTTELFYANQLRRSLPGKYDPVHDPGAIRESTWEKRKALGNHTVQIRNRHYDVRFNAKLEAPLAVPPTLIMTSMGPEHVRIKHRLSFIHVHAGIRLDFTQVFSATSEADALTLAYPTSHEIEIELLRESTVLTHTCKETARHLIANALSLLNASEVLDAHNVVDTRKFKKQQ